MSMRPSDNSKMTCRHRFACGVTAAIALFRLSTACSGTVPKVAMPCLALAPSDLRSEVVILFYEREGNATETTSFNYPSHAPAANWLWSGGVAHSNRANRDIDIQVAICSSSLEATQAAEKAALGMSQPIPKANNHPAVVGLVDKAWCVQKDTPDGIRIERATLIASRDNVAFKLSLGCRSGFAPGDIRSIVASLCRKIDAASAGKPEPAPLLPPSVEDMKCPVEEAWADAVVVAKSKSRETIAVQVGMKSAVLVPTLRLPNGERLAPVRYLASALQPGTHVKMDKRGASFTLAGQSIRIGTTAEGTNNGRAMRLRQAPVLSGKSLLVPLSMVETLFSKRITWDTYRGVRRAWLP